MAQVVRETTTTDTADAVEPTVNPRAEHGMTVAERIIYLIGGIIIGLLAIRFILSLLAANRGNGFADFIYSVTHPFVSPFFGLFNYDEQFGQHRFEWETLVAIVVYALIMAVLARLVTLGSHRADV
jgi:hypothetical protein